MNPTPLPAEKGFPVGALSELPQLLRDFGLDPWELLENYGVRRDMMHKPLTPLPVLQHGRILQAAVEATGCPHLGLLLGQRATLETAGPLRHLALNDGTQREAVAAVVRFAQLWHPAMTIGLVEHNGQATLALSMEGRFAGALQLLTACLAAMIKHLEGIFDRSWRPVQVQLGMEPPAGADPYLRFFRAPVHFGMQRHAIVFDAAGLDTPRRLAAPHRDTALQQQLTELETRNAPDFRTRVRHVIENLLPAGDCNVERVAELFAMHRFTLYRYLQESGTTFETLLAQTRADMATTMLQHTAMPIGDIALALGYSTSTSFGRAFTRWFGKSPKDWRKSMLGIRRGLAAAPAPELRAA